MTGTGIPKILKIFCFSVRIRDHLPFEGSFKLVTAFYSVFEGKLNKLREKLKQELEVSKDKRNKKLIKQMLKEARSLKKTLKKMNVIKNKVCCPNCNHEFTN